MEFAGEPVALLDDGQFARALVEPGVGQGVGRVRGDQFDQFDVASGELGAAEVVGEHDDAHRPVAVADGHAQQGRHRRVGLGPPPEAGVAAQVGQADGLGLGEDRGEHAVLAGQRPDLQALLLADAVGDELGEAARVVGDADRGVVGADQAPGRGDDHLEHLPDRQVAGDRADGRRHLVQQRGGVRIGSGHASNLVESGGRALGRWS